MKKFFAMLVMAFILIGANTALASPQQVNTLVSPNSYVTIVGGNSVIIDNGDGTINISGYTSTSYAVDKIGLNLNLQYLYNGSWYNLTTYSYTQYSSSYISGGQHLGVSPGYYYRVVGEHTSLDGGISERGQSYTAAIYIP